WVGLLIFALSLGVLAGIDLLGWGVATSEWLDVTKALTPTSKLYIDSGLSGWASLVLTYLFLLAVLSIGASVMGLDVRRFAITFSIIFWISYVCILAGHNAYIAATPDKRAKFELTWSLGLTGEAGYILALLVGLALGNFFPREADWLKEGAR